MRFPEGDQGLNNLADRFWPVGSIHIRADDLNPADLFGGTWTAFGAGRVLVGLDAGQPEFDTLLETGGAKTHTLTVPEMPSHTHTQNPHNHVENLPSTATGGLVGCTPDASTNTSVASGYSTANTTATNQNTGGGGAHNNLQPYLVVKMWRRTG